VSIHARETGNLAAWWGFAEADPVAVGIVVAALACLAVAFVAMRLRRGGRAKRD
jgi:hypothetical protein